MSRGRSDFDGMGVVLFLALLFVALMTLWVYAPRAGAEEPIIFETVLKPSSGLDIGPPDVMLWGTCYMSFGTKTGDVRIHGDETLPCINALETAVRLARAERRVNAARHKAHR